MVPWDDLPVTLNTIPYCFPALSMSLDLFVFCFLKFGFLTVWKHSIADTSLFHICMNLTHWSCGP